MAFVVDQAIWERFPGMLLVVAYAEGCNNQSEAPNLKDGLEKAQVDLKKNWQYQNPQSHPNISIWRDTFQQAMNLSGKNFPSSIEAMCRRVLTGRGINSINALVDFYNTISLRFIVPVGGWDVNDIYKGDIFLRSTKNEERFTEIGSANFIYVQEGEIAYTDAEEVLTRHFVWRQSETAKITPQTCNVFLVSEILKPLGYDTADAVKVALSDGLRRYFGVTPLTKIMRGGDTRWDWR